MLCLAHVFIHVVKLVSIRGPYGGAEVFTRKAFDLLVEPELFGGGLCNIHPREEERSLLGFEWVDEFWADQDHQFGFISARGLVPVSYTHLTLPTKA